MSPTRITQPLLVAVIAGIFASWCLGQAAGTLDPDAYYHYLVSRGIAGGRLWFDIGWLPYTVLGEAGPDHHWLWHLLMAPFGWVQDPATGLQVATTVGFLLVPAGITVFLQASGVHHAWLWALLALVAGEVVAGRLMMLRAQNLALLLVLATLYCLYHRQRIALVIVGFVFMASYHGAVVLGGIAGLYLAWSWWAREEADWLSPLLLGCGVLAGLIITPWPGENIDYLLFHTLYKTNVTLPGMSGSEWVRLPLSGILLQAWPAHFLLISALVVRYRAGDWRSGIGVLCLATTLLFLLLFLTSWRFVEYYVPLAVVTSAVLFTESKLEPGAPLQRVTLLLPSVLFLIGALQSTAAILGAKRFDTADYAAVSEHLATHASPGSIVVNSHWPDFPMLLWPTGELRFVAGLDGSYLAFAEPDRFKLWWQLAAEDLRVDGDVAQVVAESFNSEWVVVNRGHGILAERLDASPSAERVAASDQVVLYRLTP